MFRKDWAGLHIAEVPADMSADLQIVAVPADTAAGKQADKRAGPELLQAVGPESAGRELQVQERKPVKEQPAPAREPELPVQVLYLQADRPRADC